VPEDVLAVGRPVLEAAKHLDHLGVDVRDTDFGQRLLPGSLDLLVNLRQRTLVHFLDTGGVDPAIRNELLQRQPGDLAPDRIEARQDHGLRSVVDDQVDTGECLEGSDVPALSPDDPALHVVGGQGKDRDGRLRSLLRGHPLDGDGHDLPGSLLAFLPGLLFDLADGGHGIPLRLIYHLRHERIFGLLSREMPDPLQLPALLHGSSRDLLPEPLQLLLGPSQAFFPRGQLLKLSVELLLSPGQPFLVPLDLFSPQADVLLRLLPHGGDLLFDLQQCLADAALRLQLGVGHELGRSHLRRLKPPGHHGLPGGESHGEARHQGKRRHQCRRHRFLLVKKQKPSGRPLRPPARRRVWRTRRAATYKGLLAASLVPPRTSRPRLFANVSYTELVFVRISLSNSQCTAERPLVQYLGLQSTRRSGLLVDRASGHEPPQCGSGGVASDPRTVSSAEEKAVQSTVSCLGLEPGEPPGPLTRQLLRALGFLAGLLEGLVHDLTSDAFLEQVGPDRSVAYQPSAHLVPDHLLGETTILDQPGVLESVESLLHLLALEPGQSESAADLLPAPPPDGEQHDGTILRRAPRLLLRSGIHSGPPGTGQPLPLNRPAPRRARFRPGPPG